MMRLDIVGSFARRRVRGVVDMGEWSRMCLSGLCGDGICVGGMVEIRHVRRCG